MLAQDGYAYLLPIEFMSLEMSKHLTLPMPKSRGFSLQPERLAVKADIPSVSVFSVGMSDRDV